MIRELGGDFEEAAQILEDTWRNYEEKNKEKSLRVSYKISEIIMDDLERLRDENKKDYDKPQRIVDPEAKKPEDWDDTTDGAWEPHTIDNPEYKEPNDYGHWPKNGQQLTFSFPTLDLSREEAYQRAVEIVMVDPRYRICEIALCAGDVYTVRCWKASETAEMTFERGNGEHVLFYSKRIFRWSDEVPV